MSPPATALQLTMIARTDGRIVLPSVPVAYTTAAVSGPNRKAPRPPGGEGAAVTAGTSLVLDDIPEPLVRTRVLDPLHLRGVRGPVHGVCLSGELAHSGDRRGDLLQMLGDRGVDGELRAEPLGDPGDRGRHRLEQARQAGQERVQVQGVLRRPGADALGDRFGGSIDVVGHGALPFLVRTLPGRQHGPEAD